MKAKFKTKNKGRITQYFGGSPASNPTQYTTRGTNGHSGVDTVLGWNKPVTCDNDCFVYKVIESHQSKENWQGVYMLVDDGENVVEVIQGHFNTVIAEEGYFYPEGAVIGLEGNKGYVFSGGVQITPAMQKAGDQRGTHTHTAYRPVRKVSKTKRSEFYLLDIHGKKYQKDGFYFEIIHKNNGYNGCVNPYLYLDEDTIPESISMIRKLLDWIKNK